ncbi:MAG: fliF, partial [Rickettsiaceae bacterium]|nr:fliF [Rickettsiaceae bacterium]
QVARSTQTVEEKEASTEGGQGGNVSAANNLPGGGAAAESAAGAASNNAKVDEITNFEVSKTIKKHIKEVGTVKRISIAVLVDGNYEYNEQTEETSYTPRADEELKKLEELVRSAVGLKSW